MKTKTEKRETLSQTARGGHSRGKRAEQTRYVRERGRKRKKFVRKIQKEAARVREQKM